VREMVGGVIDAFPQLGDGVFVSARQVNLETIHQHNVVAERFGTLGEIRAELTGAPPSDHTSLQAWLAATA
jgi:GTP cyclohydrolase-4